MKHRRIGPTEFSKKHLIKKLCDKKADENNAIDLNAYAIGLSEMYDALRCTKTKDDKILNPYFNEGDTVACNTCGGESQVKLHRDHDE